MTQAQRYRSWLNRFGQSATLYYFSSTTCPCMTYRDANNPAYSKEWHSLNPYAEDCNGTGQITALGAEMAPALTAPNWTCTDGWSASGGVLTKVSGSGTGTATPSGAFSVTASGVYKVVMTISAVSGATYTLGGTAGTALSVTTLTEYVQATNTNKIIFSGTALHTATITALSVKKQGSALSASSISLKAVVQPFSVYAQSIQANKEWLATIGEVNADDHYFCGSMNTSDGSFVDISGYAEKSSYITFDSRNYTIRDISTLNWAGEEVAQVARLVRRN